MVSSPPTSARRSPRFSRIPPSSGVVKPTAREVPNGDCGLFHPTPRSPLRAAVFAADEDPSDEDPIASCPLPAPVATQNGAGATTSPTQAGAAAMVPGGEAGEAGEDLDDDGEVGELKKVYTFLSGLLKDTLRKVGRVWGLRSAGNKQDLIFRTFLFLKDCHERKLDIIGKIAANVHCPSFQKFEEVQVLSCREWKEPPNVSVMQEALLAAGDKIAVGERMPGDVPRDEDGEEEANTPNFTLSEFARLMVLMRDDETVRSALYRLGQDLRRAELDSGSTRDAFWGVIEGRFNDALVQVRFSLEGHVEEADASAPPLCRRSAEVLKGQYRDSKAIFTSAVAKWRRSGQNDPERFVDFLSKNGLTLHAKSKRALIMFVVARLGTPFEDTFFVDMSAKTIGEGGYEAGMNGLDGSRRDEDRTGDGRSTVPDGGRRRRRGSMEMAEVVERKMEKLGKVVSSLSGPNDKNAVSTNASPFTAELSSWNDEGTMFSIVESRLEALDRAKSTGNADFVKVAQSRYEKSLATYTRMFGES